MKRILGLDLGSSSIGWAVIEMENQTSRIVKLGSRIVPLTTDDENQFSKGQAITKNSERTQMRTIRKGYDRRQMRRENLKHILESVGIKPIDPESPMELWRLRSKAASEEISLDELGRVLLHINQKRGYKSGKDDYSEASKSKYVQGINDNYKFLVENNLTLGQYFYNELLKDDSFRVKDRVYPRIAYISEFDRIIETQKLYHPEITEELVKRIKDETIFYQRRLKSCKHLVSLCEFEKKEYAKPDGTSVISGPKVAPKSSPVAQLCKVWEFVNTITITNKLGDQLCLSVEQKKQIAEFLSLNVKIKITDLKRILGLSNRDGWWIDKSVSQRNVGNTTLKAISDALNGTHQELLKLTIAFDECIDESTGEVKRVVAESVKTEPLFRLWHTLYSISDEAELRSILERRFGIRESEVLDNLCRIDFVKEGYSNKSNTAMRKILPFLMEGYVYSDACAMAGYNHSGYITKEENFKRELKDYLDPIKKGDLRQPIVEKILNQTVNVVNALMTRYGRFDEIRVELARELKQSREQRERTTKEIAKNEKLNKTLSTTISEYGFTPTRNRILKMKLWEETKHLCIYCNQPVDVAEFMSGIDVEKEHIVPRSLLFDNSSSNVTCACRKCNQEKGNMTAYDFMKLKGEGAFEEYTKRITGLLDEHSISKAKYDRLMMSKDAIPTDFIARQLKETQYVSKKAMEMLKDVCHEVHATSGSVTDFLRHIWGWDEILHNLHFEQYKAVGLTTEKEISSNGNVRTKEVIKGWSKRVDHRHHAIDALTIACTTQGIIQQLNTLNTLEDVGEHVGHTKTDANVKRSKLEKYALAQSHPSVEEVKSAAEDIMVSFKSGKKVATRGKRYVYSGGKRTLMQETLVPRGALSEQTLYGRIINNGKEEIVVKQKVSSLDAKKAESIVDPVIRSIVIDYLKAHNGKYDAGRPVKDHQGREIRSVRVRTGLSAVVPIRYDQSGVPTGFLKPGNNHHVALYKDKSGTIHESVVTFWHSVERKKYGLPIVITDPSVCKSPLSSRFPESFTSQLPHDDWEFVLSLQSNEMFVLGLTEDEYGKAMSSKDYATISEHLYRVQKIATKNYVFRHHLETSVDDKYDGAKNERLSMAMGKFIRTQSLNALMSLNPHKVMVSIIGELVDD